VSKDLLKLSFIKNNQLMLSFQEQILQGIPSELPPVKNYDSLINHAPKRKKILSKEETKLALRKALR